MGAALEERLEKGVAESRLLSPTNNGSCQLYATERVSNSARILFPEVLTDNSGCPFGRLEHHTVEYIGKNSAAILLSLLCRSVYWIG